MCDFIFCISEPFLFLKNSSLSLNVIFDKGMFNFREFFFEIRLEEFLDIFLQVKYLFEFKIYFLLFPFIFTSKILFLFFSTNSFLLLFCFIFKLLRLLKFE